MSRGPPQGPPRRRRADAFHNQPSNREIERARQAAPEAEQAIAGPERIQKALASAGLASRREIEEWIRTGRVTVNGLPAQIGQKIGPRDRVKVDGKPVRSAAPPQPARVLAYKKRTGEIVTRDDPEGRRTVFRKLPKLQHGRWIAIGRLDINTSGLLLFTNDGELARRLMHPSFELDREYAVRVLGAIDDRMLERLRNVVTLDDGPAKFEELHAIEAPDGEEGEPAVANRWFRVTVREGRNRLVRRLWESQGCQVSRLIRLRFGPIELGRGQRSATARELEKGELKTLLAAVGMTESPGAEAGTASVRSRTSRGTADRANAPAERRPRPGRGR